MANGPNIFQMLLIGYWMMPSASCNLTAVAFCISLFFAHHLTDSGSIAILLVRGMIREIDMNIVLCMA